MTLCAGDVLIGTHYLPCAISAGPQRWHGDNGMDNAGTEETAPRSPHRSNAAIIIVRTEAAGEARTEAFGSILPDRGQEDAPDPRSAGHLPSPAPRWSQNPAKRADGEPG